MRKKMAWLYRKRYDGLDLVNKIRQAIRKGENHETIGSFVRIEFYTKLQSYLEQEAVWLLPFLPGEDKTRQSVEAQHSLLIRKVTAEWQLSPVSPALPEEFANLLEENIRFEIRTLFPLVEQAIHEISLAGAV